MAVKNPELDERILQSAQNEFLENGYKNASVRKIAAQAGVTFGAIYTRYPTKDALFCSLVQPLIDSVSTAFSSIRGSYFEPSPRLEPDAMAQAMNLESQAILQLLFADYDRSVLLLCRSAGSSLESFFDQLVERKIQETLVFFRAAGVPQPDEPVLRLLISGQFHMYVQIIRDGYDLETAKALMSAAMVYHTGGWMALFRHQGNDKTEA